MHTLNSSGTTAAVSTVMVVEDDPATVYLLRRYVQESGCRVVSTGADEEVLALARRERPAVIVLDIMLGGMDGQEVFRALKADPATRDIPVVVFSFSDDDEACSKAEGADGYLRKPVLYRDFLAALENAGVQLRS